MVGVVVGCVAMSKDLFAKPQHQGGRGEERRGRGEERRGRGEEYVYIGLKQDLRVIFL